MAILFVGNSLASMTYIRNKIKACKNVGIETQLFHFNDNIEKQTLINIIKELNANDSVDAIMPQIPFPKHINKFEIIEAIDQGKDVDFLKQVTNLQNMIYNFRKSTLQPCTPSAVMHILDQYKVPLRQTHVCLIGRGILVGYPLTALLLKRLAKVTMINEFSKDVENHVKKSDVVISAVGKRHLIKGDWIKPGSVVIDVGVSKGVKGLDKEKIVGDIEYDKAVRRARIITPVPGGIGPITV